MTVLRSTTALMMSLSLAAPVPAFAQAQSKAETSDSVVQCADADQPPCLTPEGNLKIDLKGKARGRLKTLEDCADDPAALTVPCRLDGETALVEPKSPEAMEALLSKKAGKNKKAGGKQAAAEPVPAAPADDRAAGAETAPAPKSADGEAATAEAAPEPQTVPAAPADDKAAAAEPAPAPKAADSEAATAEAAPEPQTAPKPEATPEMSAETPAPEAKSDQPLAVQQAPAEKEAKSATAKTAKAPKPNPAEDVVVADQAPAAAAAADDTADTSAEKNVVVETEKVTEDTARKSSQDFATKVTGEQTATAGATAAPEARKGKSGGLTNFEKALAIGLGAVVVGSLLDNGDKVVSNSGDRVVVRTGDGNLRVLKDDDALLRQPGSQVQTKTFSDGSTRTTVTREDGTRIVTIRAADGRVLRRTRVLLDGTQVLLFDDTGTDAPVDITRLRQQDTTRTIELKDTTDVASLRAALAAAQVRDTGRTYSLRQIRQIREVRDLAPMIELDAITFATGSAAIEPSQAEELASLGVAMARMIHENPGEVFLIEGHTDAVGDAGYNLALSDRRAETVALALTEYFDVPPENMVTQGYGESILKIQTDGPERENRRAAVRRITPLLRRASLN